MLDLFEKLNLSIQSSEVATADSNTQYVHQLCYLLLKAIPNVYTSYAIYC